MFPKFKQPHIYQPKKKKSYSSHSSPCDLTCTLMSTQKKLMNYYMWIMYNIFVMNYNVWVMHNNVNNDFPNELSCMNHAHYYEQKHFQWIFICESCTLIKIMINCWWLTKPLLSHKTRTSNKLPKLTLK